MNSHERILKAINNLTPDHTPMDFGGTAMSLCTPEFLGKMRKILGYELPADRDLDGIWVDEAIQRYLDTDLRWVPWEPPLVQLQEIDSDEYERILDKRKREKPSIQPHIKTSAVRHDFPLAEFSIEQIKNLKPNLPEPPIYLDWIIKTARNYRNDGYATTYWVSGGFFESGCASRGYDRFAMDMLLEPDLVRYYFDILMEERLYQVETVVKPLAPYIDIFCYGDDLGLQTGPFMSPVTFREIVMPYFTELYRLVHKTSPDSKIFHHSCGSIYRLLDDIIDMGVDVINPIQPGAFEMDAGMLKEKGRGRICFHGGIDLQYLLPYGTPGEIREETERRKKILGNGGGYICAPAHSLPEDVPPENILALFGRL